MIRVYLDWNIISKLKNVDFAPIREFLVKNADAPPAISGIAMLFINLFLSNFIIVHLRHSICDRKWFYTFFCNKKPYQFIPLKSVRLFGRSPQSYLLKTFYTLISFHFCTTCGNHYIFFFSFFFCNTVTPQNVDVFSSPSCLL